jgi:hypothetical protein
VPTYEWEAYEAPWLDDPDEWRDCADEEKEDN